jgi:amino acid transporter
MARWGAVSKAFGRVHPRYQTPTFSTVLMGAMSVVWFVAIVNLSTNVLADSVTALGFLIAFYYGLTGVACAVYYRRELRRSPRSFVLLGLAPLLGGAMLFGIFVKALLFYGDAANTSSPAVLGLGVPVVVGVGSLVLGVVVMTLSSRSFPKFFHRPTEVADPALLKAAESAGRA